jgi:hypothetical protein
MNTSLAIASKDQLLCRIRGEYLEMPGLRLTRAQAQRLWGLDEQACAVLLESLTADGFLAQREDGMYVRSGESTTGFPPTRMIKVDRTPRLRTAQARANTPW